MKNTGKRPRVGLKLAPFFRSLSGEYDHHLYTHMFREDVALAIMPIGGSSRRHPEFSAQMTGVDSDKAIALLNSMSEGGGRDLNQIVCKAVEKIVKDLTWYGSSIYEVFARDGVSNIFYISPRRTFYLPWVTIQIVPSADQEQWQRKYSFCRNSSIWRISVPTSLGGRRGYVKTIKSLNAVTPGATPEFVSAELHLGVNNSHFNMREYDLLQAVAINKATRLWSWHRRDSSEDKQSEYYAVYKRTKFRYAQALLREHVICELNKLFKSLGFKCELSVSGIPTSEHILLVLGRLENGDIIFKQVYEQTSV